MFGSTGSGKTHCLEGSNSDPGLASLIGDNLFNLMEDKRFRTSTGQGNFQFQIKMRYVEIVDEEVRDLLQGSYGVSRNTLQVVLNEWEGASVNGVQWVPMANQHQLADFIANGSRNRTQKQNEFGRMSEKATAVFSLEITQITESGSDTNVLVSRLNIVDLPSCEILNEDPEALRVKQGSTLNRGIQALNTLIRELSANQHGDNAYYEGSTVTQLLRDSFGGNSLTMGIFTVQYGDPIGSTLTLRAMKRCQAIMNFPVINDNRTIGLLRKYRIELAAH